MKQFLFVIDCCWDIALISSDLFKSPQYTAVHRQAHCIYCRNLGRAAWWVFITAFRGRLISISDEIYLGQVFQGYIPGESAFVHMTEGFNWEQLLAGQSEKSTTVVNPSPHFGRDFSLLATEKNHSPSLIISAFWVTCAMRSNQYTKHYFHLGLGNSLLVYIHVHICHHLFAP